MLSTIVLVTLFAVTLGAPTPSSLESGVKNIVPTSNCSPSGTATLKTSTGTGSFVINNNTLSFDPSNQGQGLSVQFQSCSPNFGGFQNTDDVSIGHVFVSSTNQCLLVQDVTNPTPGVVVGPCETPDDSRQILLSWMKKGGQVFWSGETKADGSQFQGAPLCKSGTYGFQSGQSGSPAAGTVTLACTDAAQVSGFALSQ